jgi:VWFA-related protein
MRAKAYSFVKRLVIFILLLGLAAVSVLSQDNKPDEVIRIDTNLIQTNVTVVDKDGRFVQGLKPDQFVLKIDGKPMKIDFFEPVLSSRSTTTFADGSTSGEQASPTNSAAGNAGLSLRERRVVFFVDDVHMVLDSIARTRSTILHFIDYDMMPLDQVLIVTSSGNLGSLQMFTNNKALLRAAVDRLRVFPSSSQDTDQPPMPDYIGVRIANNDTQAADYYVDKMMETFNAKRVTPLNRAAALDMVKNRATRIVTAMAMSTNETLRSLENLLQTTIHYKTRKIVFLISDGFYLESKHVSYSTRENLERSIDLATRAGASIYSIDARGLFSLAGGSAANERPMDPQGRIDRGAIGEEAASQSALATLANETGGKFLKNQNYFDKWVDKVIDENSSYYVLAWTPDKDELLTRKFKSIDVDVVGRPDLKVRQQRGYLTLQDKPDSQANKTTDKKRLSILLSLNYLDVPNVGGVLSSSVQVPTTGLNYGANHGQPAALEVQAGIFDKDDKQVGSFRTGLTINPPAADVAPGLDQNVIYNEKTPLAPGLYQVKIRVQEAAPGSIGQASQWIEIPDLSKQQLTMGSLFLNGKLVGNTAKPDGGQVQFSIDHRFSSPVTLEFMSFVYNAAHSNTSEVNLATRVEVINLEGRAVIDTDLRPLATKGNADLARIPVRGSIKQQAMSPGNYLLRVTVADNVAKTRTVQQTVFIIE